jgi:hypothetical protein
MEKKHIIRLINEEIGDYDFIGLDKMNEEDSNNMLLNGKEFQTQFVFDVVNNFKNTIKLADVNASSSNDEDLFKNGSETGDAFNLEYDVDIIYNYLGKSIPLTLVFEGHNIQYGMGGYYNAGNYDMQPEGDAYFTYINWSDINLTVYDGDGGEVKMKWIRGNKPLYDTFIKKFTEDIIKYDIQKRK